MMQLTDDEGTGRTIGAVGFAVSIETEGASLFAVGEGGTDGWLSSRANLS